MTGQQMPWVDHAWLRMDTPVNLMVVNSVIWTDEPIDMHALRAVLVERMVRQFPRFTQRPESAHLPFGSGRWVDDPGFDIDEHLIEVTLDAPGGTAQLQRYVGEQMEKPLPADRPLWQVHLLSGYRGGSAALFRVHHAVADGMALARVLLSLTDEQPDAGFTPPAERTAPSHSRLGQVGNQVGHLVHEGFETLVHPSRLLHLGTTAVRDVARLAHLADLPLKDERSLLNQPLDVPKLATWTQPIPLDVVKRIGREHGCTVNDVLVASLGGAFRSYLLGRGEVPHDIRVMVPVDLRPPNQPLPRDLGNAFGLFFVDVPAGTADADARMHAVHEQMLEIKHSPEAVVTISVLAGMGAAPGLLEDFTLAYFVTKVSGVVTNVPGPQQPVYLAGTEVTGVIGWVPRAGDLSFGVAIFSYNGTVTVGVASDAAVVPDPQALVAALETEVQSLQAQLV
jgi:WS/DGAT/MGAT family acyltransferase